MRGALVDSQFFPGASPGSRLRFLAGIVVAIFVLAFAFNGWLAWHEHYSGSRFWWVVLAPAAGFPIVAASWIFSKVRGYVLSPDELQIIRFFRIDRLPLTGLEEAEAGRHLLQPMRKIWGNDGFGTITGTFQNDQLGRFSLHATDLDKAVVLRWTDRCVVISPEQPDAFVEAIKFHLRR